MQWVALNALSRYERILEQITETVDLGHPHPKPYLNFLV